MKKDILVKIVLVVAVAALVFSAVKLGVRAYQDKVKIEKDESIAALYPSGKSAQKLDNQAGDGTPEKEEAQAGQPAAEKTETAAPSAEKILIAKPLAAISLKKEPAEEKTDEELPESEKTESEPKESEQAPSEAEERNSLLKKNFKAQKKLFDDTAAANNEKKNSQKPSSEKKDKSDFIPENAVIQSDFSALYEKNEDIVGWLIAGENVDYPVVWRDNTFYLDHDFYGSSDANGTLFVNEENTMWPADDVILIHGHNMNNGAMFGKLLNFVDYGYLSQYPLVSFRTIYDEDEYVYYVPVAAFNASMTEGNPEYFDILQMNFENAQDYQHYLDSLQAWSAWKSPAGVTPEDSLLMLVTCSYDQDDGRFMLVCRKLRDGETTDDIQRLFAAPVSR